MRSPRAPLRLLRLAAASLAVVAGGCYTVTPFGSINTIATGGQNYIAGYGTQAFPASDGLTEQARKVLDTDLGVAEISQRREGDAVVFHGIDPKGRRASIRITPESDGSKMRIHARFGLFGDEALSRAYLDRLAVRLGGVDGEEATAAKIGEGSPALSLRANSADAPPGSTFQRRLEGGVREMPYP